MNQILSAWTALDMRKRSIVLLATVAMFAAVLGVARMATQPSMALLYAGLEPGPAGEVIQALETQAATYEVRGGAIYVDQASRDELRMTLASQGLPANSAKGYELLDGLTGFGTTSQMFDAAYWRAKEGELARTIVASPQIQSARVHIGVPSSSGLRARAAPTGSVTVTTVNGTLSPAQAKALRYLVASAVPGLAPEDVSAIDARGGLIASDDTPTGLGVSGADRAEELKRSVEHLLEARVGYGNAVVELTVDTATESEVIHERSFDPQGRVAISTETEETAATATDSQAPGVTVASNLPNGNATAGTGSSNSNNTETRERVNYEVSETTREIQRAPGTVRRISVAVLVDGIPGVDAAGAPVWEPRPESELQALRELVASAVGFDEARGDTITIKSMQFEPVATSGAETTAGLLAGMNLDAMSLIRLTVLALVALVLGLFVLRPILAGRIASASAAAQLPAPESAAPGATSLPALTGEIDDGTGPDMAVVSPDLAVGADMGLPALGGANSADPVERLRALIAERQSETVEILRGWMEDEETA